MSDVNLPKGWTATAWEVRYGDIRVTVQRRWQEYMSDHPRKLAVDWKVSIRDPAKRWQHFDGISNGTFNSEGDLATDLATAVVKAKKAMSDGVKDWGEALKEIP